MGIIFLYAESLLYDVCFGFIPKQGIANGHAMSVESMFKSCGQELPPGNMEEKILSILKRNFLLIFAAFFAMESCEKKSRQTAMSVSF